MQRALKDVFLYPPLKPNFTAFIENGSGHKPYIESCGNLNGFPAIHLHGGPGAGCTETERRYFDPNKWKLFLMDQRGCGRSIFRDRLKHNTTWDLVEDIRAMLDGFQIGKALITGRSWGVTLALAFASRYPERVAGMVLASVFLGSKEEIRWMYQDGGPAVVFPEAWARFISMVPSCEHKDIVRFYYDRMIDPQISVRIAYRKEWAIYEEAILRFKRFTWTEIEKGLVEYQNLEALATLEAHYMANYCFLDSPLLDQLGNIKHMPMAIIHGRYDMLCPFKYAKQLHQAMPNSTLEEALIGHEGGHPEMRLRFTRAIDRMYDVVTKPNVA